MAEAVKVCVLDDYQGVASSCADWASLGVDVTFYSDNADDWTTEWSAALVERCAPFDVVVTMRERSRFPRAVLEQLPKLKLLCTQGGRNASIDVAAANERGIPVCGTSGKPWSTAELTWALLLALAKKVPQEDAAMRAGGFMTALGTDLDGATLGCLGLGRLGGRVAAIGLAFGMRVVAWSENLTEERCAEIGVEKVTKEELFEQSDFVSVHLVQSSRTIGLVGAAELAAMKPSACLINTSRGPIVDEAALVAALRDGSIGGAGLDTFELEPLPRDHALRSLPNTVLTPHVGYVTQATYEVFYGDTVANIAAWRAGSEPALLLPETNLYRVHQVRLTDLLAVGWLLCLTVCCLGQGSADYPKM